MYKCQTQNYCVGTGSFIHLYMESVNIFVNELNEEKRKGKLCGWEW